MNTLAYCILLGIVAIVEWRTRRNGYSRTLKEMNEHFVRNAETQQQHMDTIQRIKNAQHPHARDV